MIYNLVRLYPFWAVPLAVVLADLGVHFRRKKHPIFRVCWGLAGVLVVGALLWLIFRGDRQADRWVTQLFGNGQISK